MGGWDQWDSNPSRHFPQPEDFLSNLMRMHTLRQQGRLADLMYGEQKRHIEEQAAMRQAQTAGANAPGQATSPMSTISALASPNAPGLIGAAPDANLAPQPQIPIGGQSVQGPPGTANPQQQSAAMIASLRGGPAAYKIPEVQADQQQGQYEQVKRQLEMRGVSLQQAQQEAEIGARYAAPLAQAESQGAPPEQLEAIYQQGRQAAQAGGVNVSMLPPHYVPGIGGQLLSRAVSAKDIYDKMNQQPTEAGLAMKAAGGDPNKALDKLAATKRQSVNIRMPLNGGVASAPLPGADIPIITQAKQPNLFKVAQDLAYGKLTMQQFRSLYAYSRDTKGKQSLYATAQSLNPNFNPAAFEMGQTLAKNPKVQQQLASLDNVIQAAPDLLKASQEASRSGIPLVNGIVLKAGINLGGKKYSNFKTAQIAFADELSGALGYGSATDMSREMGFNMTDPNLTPDQFNSSVQDIVIPFVQRKRDTLLHQMGVYGQPGMNPAAGNDGGEVEFVRDASGKLVRK